MKGKVLFALVAIMAVAIVLLVTNGFATQNAQYVYQINVHENIDSANPVKANIYIPSRATVIMKLETERYQMYGTTSYVDDIRDGNHDHIMLNEITKWNYPRNLSIEVNGKKIKTFAEEKINTEITLSQYFKTGWNEIIFYAESDGRINASIFVQVR